MRKEDIFSVALKFYVIFLILLLFINHLNIEAIIMLKSAEDRSINSALLSPYNLWILMSLLIFIFSAYIWYRANKVLKTKSSINFKEGAYLFLGLYWFFQGIFELEYFVVKTYSQNENHFGSSFILDLFFNGAIFFIVGGMVLVYWFRQMDKLNRSEKYNQYCYSS